MNFARTTVSLLLLAAIGTTAQAQSEKTREQVKAEYAEAVRTGDVIPAGDAGLKLNELYPQRYPHGAVAVAVSRAQVKAELAEAIRTGDMMATGELGLKLNEEFPQRYPAIVAVASTKTRDQVNAETREAIRNGDMYAAAKACRSSTKSFRIAMPRPARFTPARRRTRRHRPRARSCTDRETGLTRSLNRE
jgi:hypothetical protein